jgi:hypothetical protein
MYVYIYIEWCIGLHICTINHATLQDYWGVCGWHVGPLSVFGADADNSLGHIEPFDGSCFGKFFMEKRMQALPLFLKKIHVNRCEHFWTDVNTCWQMQTKLNNCKRMQQNVRPWFPMNLPLIHHPFWWGCWEACRKSTQNRCTKKQTHSLLLKML